MIEQAAPATGLHGQFVAGRFASPYWLFFPCDKAIAPARVAGTPSSQRSWANFVAALERKGYKE